MVIKKKRKQRKKGTFRFILRRKRRGKVPFELNSFFREDSGEHYYQLIKTHNMAMRHPLLMSLIEKYLWRTFKKKNLDKSIPNYDQWFDIKMLFYRTHVEPYITRTGIFNMLHYPISAYCYSTFFNPRYIQAMRYLSPFMAAVEAKAEGFFTLKANRRHINKYNNRDAMALMEYLEPNVVEEEDELWPSIMGRLATKRDRKLTKRKKKKYKKLLKKFDIGRSHTYYRHRQRRRHRRRFRSRRYWFKKRIRDRRFRQSLQNFFARMGFMNNKEIYRRFINNQPFYENNKRIFLLKYFKEQYKALTFDKQTNKIKFKNRPKAYFNSLAHIFGSVIYNHNSRKYEDHGLYFYRDSRYDFAGYKDKTQVRFDFLRKKRFSRALKRNNFWSNYDQQQLVNPFKNPILEALKLNSVRFYQPYELDYGGWSTKSTLFSNLVTAYIKQTLLNENDFYLPFKERYQQLRSLEFSDIPKYLVNTLSYDLMNLFLRFPEYYKKKAYLDSFPQEFYMDFIKFRPQYRDYAWEILRKKKKKTLQSVFTSFENGISTEF